MPEEEESPEVMDEGEPEEVGTPEGEAGPAEEAPPTEEGAPEEAPPEREPTPLEGQAPALGFTPFDPGTMTYDQWEMAFLGHVLAAKGWTTQGNWSELRALGFRVDTLNRFMATTPQAVPAQVRVAVASDQRKNTRIMVVGVVLLVVGLVAGLYIGLTYGRTPWGFELTLENDPGPFSACCGMGIVALIGGILLLLGVIRWYQASRPPPQPYYPPQRPPG